MEGHEKTGQETSSIDWFILWHFKKTNQTNKKQEWKTPFTASPAHKTSAPVTELSFIRLRSSKTFCLGIPGKQHPLSVQITTAWLLRSSFNLDFFSWLLIWSWVLFCDIFCSWFAFSLWPQMIFLDLPKSSQNWISFLRKAPGQLPFPKWDFYDKPIV